MMIFLWGCQVIFDIFCIAFGVFFVCHYDKQIGLLVESYNALRKREQPRPARVHDPSETVEMPSIESALKDMYRRMHPHDGDDKEVVLE